MIKRKRGMRHLRLVIYPYRPMEIRAGLRVSKDELLQFIRAREQWILKHQMKQATAIPPYEPRFADGESIPWDGGWRQLKVLPTVLKKSFVVPSQEVFSVYIPIEKWTEGPSQIERIFSAWARTYAENLIASEFQSVCEKCVLRPSKLNFRTQKTRWGSCSRSGAISLNRKLALAPDWVRRYVYIHELSHLVYFNHSPDFWSLIQKLCPDWKKAELWLDQSSHIFVHSFLG